jgi:O-acetyl-ADP-ribose deacetylase (regulator of RNase III)
MPDLHYVIGDATTPIKTPAIIAHVCNDIGAWGRGFVMALSAKSPLPEEAYRAWKEGLDPPHPPFELGEIQTCAFQPSCSRDNILVANMIAQQGIRWEGNTPPIRYESLRSCLSKLYARTSTLNKGFTVHMPRIGCVLAGGKWEEIAKVIEETMTVDTVVYTLEKQKDRWDDTYEDTETVRKLLG